MAVTLLLDFSQSSDCETLYFNDVSQNYSTGDNPSRAEITSTTITLTDSSGNAYTYSDYLPTMGEIGLLWTQFTQTASEEDTEDCGCCNCTEETLLIAPDGCFSLSYQVYVDEVLQAAYGENLFFYCSVRNEIFDLIQGSCDDCCDSEKQLAISELMTNYNIMLITYNKLQNCGCSEKMLSRLNKKIDNLDNDCNGC